VALYLPPAECRGALERRIAEGSPWAGYFQALLERLSPCATAAQACAA